MKAVLSVPHHWRENRRYAPLDSREFKSGLGRQIAQDLRKSAAMYRAIPMEVPVEIEWTKDNVNPALTEPTLFVTAEGASSKPQPESVAQATYRLARALGMSHLFSLIPDCNVHLTVVSEHTEPIGG